jgi:NMD protein affecting ribosome stability and mRNA decay
MDRVITGVVVMSGFSKSSKSHTQGTPVKGYAGVRENEHDPYRLPAKLAEPTYCPDCSAVYERGRWQWKERVSANAPRHRCPACQRIHDDFPAGYVHIEGDYARTHREELMHLITHRGEHAKAEHPLQRIMAVQDTADGWVVTTTDVHLARGIGEALHGAHHGELKLHYSDGETLVRVHWHR